MPIDPLVGASLISGGLGLFGSGMNAAFTGRANRRAQKIAQMNNEFQAREAVKNRDFIDQQRRAQNDWNLEQWNREADYNSASSQRTRLEEAGLNPYLMMSGGSAGVATSASSAGNTSGGSPTGSPSMPSIIPESIDLSSVSNAISSYFVNSKLASEKIGQDIQNINLDDLFKSQVAGNVKGNFEQLTPEYRNKRQSEALNLLGIDVNQKLQGLEMTKALTEMHLAERSKLILDATAQETLNKYLDNQQQVELFVKSAIAYNQYHSGNLSIEQVKTEVAKQVESYARANNLDIDTKILTETSEDLIDSLKAEYKSNKAYYEALETYGKRLADQSVERGDLENAILKIQKAIGMYDQNGGYFWDKLLEGVDRIINGYDAYSRRHRPVPNRTINVYPTPYKR